VSAWSHYVEDSKIFATNNCCDRRDRLDGGLRHDHFTRLTDFTDFTDLIDLIDPTYPGRTG